MCTDAVSTTGPVQSCGVIGFEKASAIALGHPLGMSGARLALTATQELQERGAKRAVATMCIGVGQGIALLLERV